MTGNGAVSAGQKSLAAGLAEDGVNRARREFRQLAETFCLNPSDIVRDALEQTITALQEAREVQRAVAEWQVSR